MAPSKWQSSLNSSGGKSLARACVLPMAFLKSSIEGYVVTTRQRAKSVLSTTSYRVCCLTTAT